MVRINPGFHPMECPTLHHFTYRPVMYGMAEQNDEDFFAWRRRQRVSIGNGAVVGGVAAKLIRYRFPRAIAQALEATAWWQWDHATLTARLPEFKDLRTFLAKYAP